MARILLIDDDSTVRYALKQVLERAGHQVEEATDGQIGLQMYASGRQDVVVTDIIMPNKEGIETIIELRRMAPDLRIIAMSGGGRTGNRDFLAMAEKLGAARIIAKPFRPRELVEAVDTVLKAA
ncbi:MAG: response regulator [Alphaproteobacteria bacterium]|nr:response regulator [Alphaproteobacteria bacterium]